MIATDAPKTPRGPNHKATRDIQERTTFHDPPTEADAFDPFKASNEDLKKFALPLKPDAASQPALYRAWVQFFTPPEGKALRIVRGEFAGHVEFAYVIGEPRGPEGSLNWSGGYVTPTGGASFDGMAGDWRVPTVTLPGGGSMAESFVSSTFIGLDGQRRYRNSSLPQIGTSQIAGANPFLTLPPYHAWMQWWERGHSTSPVPLNVAVYPGYRVVAFLTVLSPTKVRFNIAVHGTVLTGIDVTAPKSDGIQYQVSGATAEWIMERASSLTPPHPAYRLPRFTAFSFRNCAATATDTTAQSHNYTMRSGRLIRMQDTPYGPLRRRTVAVARRVSPQRVGLRYTGP